MFGSAIFYPLTFVPDWARPWFSLNPLAVLIDDSRKVLIWGVFPEFLPLAILTVLGLLLVLLGFLFFEKSKPAFADVM
jgi:lipopolysaccharide transport system permease protein